jgi:hypothetical protein
MSSVPAIIESGLGFCEQQERVVLRFPAREARAEEFVSHHLLRDLFGKRLAGWADKQLSRANGRFFPVLSPEANS